MNLGPEAVRAGYGLEHVPQTGSTNADLVAAARGGTIGPLWRVADSQAEGRGRQGRDWVSPPGNLYASVLLCDPAPVARVAELSFVLALALRDAALKAGCMAHAVTLKWPNDLMIGGLKGAGLLLEGGEVNGHSFVVAGMGVNLVSAPSEAPFRATSLGAAGASAGRDTFFAWLTDAVCERLGQWAGGQGFASIRADWLACAHGLGGPLLVRTRDARFEGRFETIDAAGRLVVATGDGRRTVSAGDVFVLSDGEELG